MPKYLILLIRPFADTCANTSPEDGQMSDRCPAGPTGKCQTEADRCPTGFGKCPTNVRQLSGPTGNCQTDVRQLSDRFPANVRQVSDKVCGRCPASVPQVFGKCIIVRRMSDRVSGKCRTCLQQVSDRCRTQRPARVRSASVRQMSDSCSVRLTSVKQMSDVRQTHDRTRFMKTCPRHVPQKNLQTPSSDTSP